MSFSTLDFIQMAMFNTAVIQGERGLTKILDFKKVQQNFTY